MCLLLHIIIHPSMHGMLVSHEIFTIFNEVTGFQKSSVKHVLMYLHVCMKHPCALNNSSVYGTV